MEFDFEGTNTTAAALNIRDGSTGCEVYNNIFHNKAASRTGTVRMVEASGGGTSVDVHDNIIFNATNSNTGTIVGINCTNGGTTNVYNNTVTDLDNSNVGGTCFGIVITDDVDHAYVNNLVTDIKASGGGTKQTYSDDSPSLAATSNNLSDDAFSPDVALRNKTITFVSAGAADFDYHLAAGDTDAIGAGVGPTVDAQVAAEDIDGDSRAGEATTDIGADLRVVVSAGNRRRRMILFGVGA